MILFSKLNSVFLLHEEINMKFFLSTWQVCFEKDCMHITSRKSTCPAKIEVYFEKIQQCNRRKLARHPGVSTTDVRYM